MDINSQINFIVFQNNQSLPINITSKKILVILPFIKCGWCDTCKEKFFIYGDQFEYHINHKLLNIHVDSKDIVTKLCWITQKYSSLLLDKVWIHFLKKYKLNPIIE